MGMKLFKVDVRIAGTAYVKAEDKTRALSRLATRDMSQLTPESFGEPELLVDLAADIAFGRTMTLYGKWPAAAIEEVPQPVPTEVT